jgi:hypothetical protein
MSRFFKVLSFVVGAGIFLFSAQAQIDLTGTVKAAGTNAAIAGATVYLTQQPTVTTTTDAAGAYHLIKNTAVRSFCTFSNGLIAAPFIRQSSLYFGVASSEQVNISVYNVAGRRVAVLVNTTLSRGNYQINPAMMNLANQVFFVKATIGNKTTMFKMPYVSARSAAPGMLRKLNGAEEVMLAKAAAASDTLHDTIAVFAKGYQYGLKAIMAVKPLTSFTGNNDFVLGTQAAVAGQIMFDQSMYTGIVSPQSKAVIMVFDTDVAEMTVKAKIVSKSDPTGFSLDLKRILDIYSGWMFADSVHFSLDQSDSTKHIIKVGNNDTLTCYYTDAAPTATVKFSSTWSGVSGSVQPNQSMYLSLRDSMRIDLTDADLTSDTASIKITSIKDSVTGIWVVCKKTTPGTYKSPYIGFTTGPSIPNKKIQVTPEKQNRLSLYYYDKQPLGTQTGFVLWDGKLGFVNLDCDPDVGYIGTTTPANVTLTDADILDTTAVVSVTSKKDPTGITLKLTGPDGNLAGDLKFSTTASSATTGTIAVMDGDTISVTYHDDTPAKDVVQQAPWHLK